MSKQESKCEKSKKPRPRPKTGGNKARFVCKRCGMKSRKKNEVCKPGAI